MNKNDCVSDVSEWLDSAEYREMNFKREALVVNPAKACQPLGAVFCASGFSGTLPFIQGSQGCTAYFRNCLSRHFREPFSAVSTSMTEDAAVFGGINNLTEGLRNAYTIYRPKMIAICTSCMAEVIGDDLNSFIIKAKDMGEVPKDLLVPFAHTPSFSGSHINGYDNMLKSILSTLTQGKKGKENRRFNIIPGFDPCIANIREIKRILELMDIEYAVIPDVSEVFDSPLTGRFELYPEGTSLETAEGSINGLATLALQKFSTMQSIKFIQENYSGQGVQVYPPVGIKATDRLILELNKLTGKPIPPEIERERGRAVDSATDAHQYFHGKKFAVYGDPDMVYSLVNFILEMGGVPVHILAAAGTKQFEAEMELLLSSFSFGKEGKIYNGKDLWHMRSLLMTEPVDMLIGDSHGKWIARDADIPLIRLGFPIFDRVNTHRHTTIGYTGTINLISLIANTFIDEMDRKSDNRYFELLR